jgi:hypothetical protein
MVKDNQDLAGIEMICNEKLLMAQSILMYMWHSF